MLFRPTSNLPAFRLPPRSICFLFSVILLFIPAWPAFAGSCGTTVAGPVTGAVWTLNGSPYCIVGDVQIAGLSIEPGVRILVESNVEMHVRSTLHAEGTEAQPIVFTSHDPKQRWKGISFDRAPAESSLIHCHIQRARNSGVRLFGSNIIIRDCVFRDNISQGEGGAIRILDGGDVVIRRTLFTQNISKSNGGAIAGTFGTGVLLIEDSIFESNLSNPSLNLPGPQRMLFDTRGGALNLDGDTVVRNCVFNRNGCMSRAGKGISSAGGGAIYSTNGTLVLENCILTRNDAKVFNLETAVAQGGAIYVQNGTLIQSNTIIACNTLSTDGANQIREGAGIYINTGVAFIENSTIARHADGGLHREGGTVSVTSSILFDNGGQSVNGAVDASYSLIDTAEIYPGVGNINDAPNFAGNGCECSDFRLLPGSAGIDRGDPDSGFSDGCTPPSVGGSRNDMGAFGGPLSCNWTNACGGPGGDELVQVDLQMLDVEVGPGEMLEVTPTIDNGNHDSIFDAYLWIVTPSGATVGFVKNRDVDVPAGFSFRRAYQIGPGGNGILGEAGTYSFGIRLTDAATGQNITSRRKTFTVIE